EAWFYSRSRQTLWKKGETSGRVLHVAEIRVDCDQDVLWLRVRQSAPGACHTGRPSCFYRAVVRRSPDGPLTLAFRDGERVFDPSKVYGGT
ncbi:MAG: phosphoribosyl-AMP cyclohydrolase, partial [Bradyrhizobiaceae bacterium]|nr:phosphoribosyl-AMP cyclohydrolase [Bradyrhizobiaceae bacterium]